MDLSFFSSSEGIAIAWLCTVLGCGYAIFQQVQVYKIKQTLNSVNLSYTELKVKNENLKIENNLLLIKIENYKNHQKGSKPRQDLRAELEGLHRSRNADSGCI